jgi:integrase/recombinase XerC
MKLSEAIRIFLDSKRGIRSVNTITWYTYLFKYLANEIGDPEVEDITLNDLRAFRSKLFELDRSPVTTRGIIRATKTLFNFCVDEGILVQSPARRLETPKLPEHSRRGVDDFTIEKMILAARVNRRDYALLLFLIDTGCRRCGLTYLKLSDLDIANFQAVVREKGPYERTVFFTEQTAKALNDWLEIRHYYAAIGVEEVFVALSGRCKGRGHTPYGIANVIRSIGHRAGITVAHSAHEFRHAFARNLVKQGANLAAVSQLLGHHDIKMTAEYYSKLDNSELQVIHDRYSILRETKPVTR